MWNLPGQGLEPMSPALASGFLTTVSPGKSKNIFKEPIKTSIQYNLKRNLLRYVTIDGGKNMCRAEKRPYLTNSQILWKSKVFKAQVGLPWWRSGWESACQCRGHGFEPWSGKIPRAAEQLGPWATITEPARLEPVLRNKRGRDSERPAHRDEEWPPLAATRESPCTETKTQQSHKIKINK